MATLDEVIYGDDADDKLDLLDDLADSDEFLDADAALVAYLNGDSVVYRTLGASDAVRDLRLELAIDFEPLLTYISDSVPLDDDA